MNEARQDIPYWSLGADTALVRLDARREGLSSSEAAARRIRDGPNELAPIDSTRAWRLLLRQYESPLVLILVFGSAVALAVQELTEASIILLIILGSTLLGFAQEYHASRAVEALRRRLALKTRAIRDGAECQIAAADVVVGDIVHLSAGDLAPADGIVLEARDFLVSEASLTGESFPVEKSPTPTSWDAPLGQRTNVAFAGSSVRSGEATVLIADTGVRTVFGGVAQRLRRKEPETEFTRGLRRFGYLLLRIMIVLVVFVLIINQLLGRPFLESLLFSVALAVGMSPELMPAIVSVTLSAGARAMARRGVLVRRLDAIENLGAIDVLCSDKTGTLTVGAAALQDALDPSGSPSTRAMRLAFMNSVVETGIANPLDQAVVAAGHARGLTVSDWRKIDEIPYDFQRKRLTIVVDDLQPDSRLIITKGAFWQVLDVCVSVRTGPDETSALAAEARAQLVEKYSAYGASGLRVLALASRRAPVQADYVRGDERDMVFEGFLTFIDPAKPDAAETISALGQAGVAVKIITGDNRFVSAHVAAAVGLGSRAVLRGDEIDRLKGDALLPAVEQAQLFVEVDPEQKERIIVALQRNGHAVGFLGDGVNDAPALFAADVGISVDQAVDVAREAADVILLERDLGVLRQGIEEGRRAFANTIKYVSITTGSSFGNMASMAFAAALLPFLPLTATQVLLTNFLTDVPLMAVATDRVDRQQIARPQRWRVRDIQSFMLVFGVLSSVFDLATFYFLRAVLHADETTFRTAWFTVSVLTELCALLVLRTQQLVWRSAPGRIIAILSGVVAAIVIAAPISPFAAALELAPLSVREWLGCIAIVSGYAVATEAVKLWYFNRTADTQPPGPPPAPAKQAFFAWKRTSPMVFGLLVLAVVIAVFTHMADLQETARLIRRAQPAWLLAALAAQVMTYACAATVWRRYLQRNGLTESLRSLTSLSVAKLFTDQTAPPSGVSGAILVMHGLRRRGAPTKLAASAVLLGIVAYYAAFLLVALLSLAFLIGRAEASPVIVASVILATAIALAAPLAIVLGRTYGGPKLKAWARRVPGAAALLDKVMDAPIDFLRDRRLMSEAVGLHIAIFVLDAATLWFALAAFGVYAPLWTAFVAFVMANVVATAALVPMGLGTFDAGSIAMLHLLGVPLEAAFAATMVLRAFTFWLPMLPGLWCARRELRSVRAPRALSAPG